MNACRLAAPGFAADVNQAHTWRVAENLCLSFERHKRTREFAQMQKQIEKILIANRGVPAVRVMQTCMKRGIRTVAVYSTPDRLSLHVSMADEAIHIGEASPLESYLNMDRIIDAALSCNADAIHPGWGFLAENPEFAARVVDAGLIWIGPSAKVIKLMGDKIRAKQIALEADVPTIPGISNVTTAKEIEAWIDRDKVDLPIMIKAAAGGGGKGMERVTDPAKFAPALEQARSVAKKAFGDDTILVEKYIDRSRHIEVQIVADEHGNVLHLFERECTMQRRNQKVIEEAPSPAVDSAMRKEICTTAVRLMKEIGYTTAGTVEFIFDTATRKFYFLEVNTRLQVEHGITELVTGLDIVSMMIDIAMGKKLDIVQDDVKLHRFAIETRINAEDPKSFNPSFGPITGLRVPQGPGVRVSPGVYEGAEVPSHYDSLFMLLMSYGATREDAVRTMDRALDRELKVEGVKTLSPLLLSIIRHPDFMKGDFSTAFIAEHIDELTAQFSGAGEEEEILKVAKYVAEISAKGQQEWM